MTDSVYMHMPFGDAVDLAGVVAEREALRRQLREVQQRIAALEAENARLILNNHDQYIEIMGLRRALEIARRAAAARLRAVKRMKRVARHYQLLALRLAVGAELAGAAEAAQRDAARAAGRGE